MVESEVAEFIRRRGVQSTLFITLTVPDKFAQFSQPELQRRWNNFSKAFSDRFGEWMKVIERSERGKLHYHIITAAESDIQTGFPWYHHDSRKRGRYPGVGRELRDIWKWLRVKGCAHGFGRCEALPIRKNKEAAARYLAGYMTKGGAIGRGVRQVSYSRQWRRSTSCRFQFLSRIAGRRRALARWYAEREREKGADEGDIWENIKKWVSCALLAKRAHGGVMEWWYMRCCGFSGGAIPSCYVWGPLPDGSGYGGYSVCSVDHSPWWRLYYYDNMEGEINQTHDPPDEGPCLAPEQGELSLCVA